MNDAEEALGHDRSEVVQKIRDISSGRKTFVPLPGSQVAFLSCPLEECLIVGERGPGKTTTLLMSFAQFVGTGFGESWRGVIIRKSFPALRDIISESKKWFYPIFPGAKFYESANSLSWKFPGGEELQFRSMEKPKDYEERGFHGQQWPFVGNEEVTVWPDDQCFKLIKSCIRSPEPGIPKWHRGTTNPGSVGSFWVKERYRLHGMPRENQLMSPVIRDSVDEFGNLEPPRCVVFSRLRENIPLLKEDPGYLDRLKASAPNAAVLKAWTEGSWDLPSGGFFEGSWDKDVNIVPHFPIPGDWRITRSYDYGSSHPWAVVWVAESSGSDYRDSDGKWHSTVRGDLFVMRELYGWTGKPNKGYGATMAKTAQMIIESEQSWGVYGRVEPGPSDSQLTVVRNGSSLAMEMEKKVRMPDGSVKPGIKWTRADQRSGARKSGWKKMADMMVNAAVPEGQFVRESPGLFVFDCCEQIIRTVPALPRKENDPEEVEKDVEDHLADCVRYIALASGSHGRSGGTVGLY